MATLPIFTQITNSINALYAQILNLLQNPTTIFSQFKLLSSEQPSVLFDITQYTASKTNNRTGLWGVNKLFQKTSLTVGKGIAQDTGTSLRKSGIGDFCPSYTYTEYGGGSVNGDDESISGYGLQMNDSNGPEYVASVISAIGNTNLSLNCTTMGWKKGHGRYLTLLQNPDKSDASVASGFIQSFTIPGNKDTWFGTITTDVTVPVSTAWGQCTGYIVTPVNNDEAQQVTFTVNVKSGSFNTQSVIAMYGGRRNERARVVSVTPLLNGQQIITALLRETYEDLVIPYVFQGGLAGTGITVSAYQKGDGSPGTQRYLVPVVGAIGPNTIVYAANGIQGQQSLQYTDEIPVAINGKANAFKLYKCAEIIGSVDETQTYNKWQMKDLLENGRYAVLEANDTTWPSGSIVECPPHYNVWANLSFVNYINNTGSGFGYHTNYSGTAIHGLFATNIDWNCNPLSTYKYYGGTLNNGPKNIVLGGPWGNILTCGFNNSDTGCMIPGSTGFYFGPAGYDRNSSGWIPFQFDTKTGEVLLKIDQPNDALVIQIEGRTYSFSPNGLTIGTVDNPNNVVIDNQGNITAKSFNVSK